MERQFIYGVIVSIINPSGMICGKWHSEAYRTCYQIEGQGLSEDMLHVQIHGETPDNVNVQVLQLNWRDSDFESYRWNEYWNFSFRWSLGLWDDHQVLRDWNLDKQKKQLIESLAGLVFERLPVMPDAMWINAELTEGAVQYPSGIFSVEH